MPDDRPISINGSLFPFREGMTVAAAVLSAGVSSFRRSVRGEARGPLCGMGICYECRLTVDGVPQTKSCQLLSRPGMEIVTDD
ncbi:MAG TPA: (2Fe-2S)-binding protein [Terriglobales bacterium]|nr:(2Fe-2S)-binding protein [Terriglobales bacterium]